MAVPELLAVALATALSSGLNVYASVAILGLLQRYQLLQLPAPMNTLEHPWVIGAALALYLVEFVADKIPYFDTAWDAAHTFIRIPIGAALAAGIFSGQPQHIQWLVAMLGGFITFQAHGAKATVRAAANASPEPFTNWALSLGEDLLVAFLLWFSTQHPYLSLALGAAMVVALFLFLRMILRTAMRLWSRLFGGRSAPAT